MSVSHTPIVNDEQWQALRAKVIGASEAAALVGVHEYLTYYGLWARKAGKLPPEPDNGAMERGRLLEPVAVEVIRKRYPDMTIAVPREHYADHEFCIGATPDLLASDERGEGVIQIKSVAPRIFRNTWRGESDAAMPPTWIVIQALIEAHLTGARWAAVAALVVDHEIDLHLIEVPLHKGIVEQIKTEALKFWEMVISGREPDPDFKRDSELVKALSREGDGHEIDLSADNELPGMLAMRETLSAEAKRCEEEVKVINAQLLHRLGSATIGRFNGGYISAKTTNRKAHEVKASSFRQLRVVKTEDA
jgi:putative phage-type endonuclease